MSNEEFISFEKALRDLQMRSEELRKLVSEGEIRAFRDGSSMKFKREDVDSLSASESFDETLEDDTGMVTEELSDEDTLLVADDDEIEDMTEVAAAPAVTASSSRGSRVREQASGPETEGPLFTAVCLLTAVMMLYGFMVAYSVATEAPPNGFTTLFSMAPKGN